MKPRSIRFTAALLTAVALTTHSVARAQDTAAGRGLKISIRHADIAEPAPRNPEFIITLENQSDENFVLVMGYMLANGKMMIPSAVTLVLTDESGRRRKLRYRGPLRVAGRVDDYIVALRTRASYVLRLSLDQFSSPDTRELEPRLHSGTYTVQATFEGRPVTGGSSDMQGLRLMNIWTGVVSSNVVTFQVP